MYLKTRNTDARALKLKGMSGHENLCGINYGQVLRALLYFAPILSSLSCTDDLVEESQRQDRSASHNLSPDAGMNDFSGSDDSRDGTQNLTPSIGDGAFGDDFLLGANLAWIDYGSDFGVNPWTGNPGFLSEQHQSAFQENMNWALEHNLSWVRLWVFADGRSGLRYDSNGRISGLEAEVVPGFEAMLNVLPDGMQVIPTLIDFHIAKDERVVDGVQLGGRSNLWSNVNARNAFLQNAIEPFVKAFADDPRILMWDLMNEPDWVIVPHGRITWDEMGSFFQAYVETVSDNTDIPITIGMGTRNSMLWSRQFEIDVLQMHWYPTTFSELSYDFVSIENESRPLFLGEFPGTASELPIQVIQDAQDAGLIGAGFWRLHTTETDNDEWSARPNL